MIGKSRRLVATLLLVTSAALALTLMMWLRLRQSVSADAGLSATQYHAVYLINGLVIYAKVKGMGDRYPVLTDVFYVRNEMKKEAKEVVNHLIKRGQEWHGPDKMVVNSRHILFFEPVAPDSRIAALIRNHQ